MGERDNYRRIADIVNEQNERSRDMAEISGEIERQKKRDKGEKVEGAYKVVHEWTYRPENYFEETVIRTKDQVNYEINFGRATAEIDSRLFDRDPKGFRTIINNEIEFLFRGAQLSMGKKLDGPFQAGHSRTIWKGKKLVRMIDKHIEEKVVVDDTFDAQVFDSDGNLKSDTKEERIKEQREIMDLAAKHGPTDRVLAGILQSFNAALDDHKKKLVHLYEIIEALEKQFKHSHAAFKALKIERKDWERLKGLANDESLKEGRHSGRKLHSLRDATKQELEEATAVSAKIIMGYLRYLEGNHENC